MLVHFTRQLPNKPKYLSGHADLSLQQIEQFVRESCSATIRASVYLPSATDGQPLIAASYYNPDLHSWEYFVDWLATQPKE